MLFGLTKVVSLLAATQAAVGKIIYAGINESGGEFGVWSPGNPGFGLPGRLGVDYAFINKSTVDIFVDKEKINLFRVTFLMERMCPLQYGLGSRFNETYFNVFADAVNYITLKKGAYAMLDPHNYMRYNDPSQQPFSGSVIGNSSDPTAATTKQFGQFWHELAKRFAQNPKVLFGINNEPHDMATELVLKNNQVAIDNIRSAGARQLIVAPGNAWTGGHSWTEWSCADCKPSSDFMHQLVDPLHNLALDIHEYLDIDFSGGHDECAQPAPQNLEKLTAWLKEHKLKAIVSEFGGGNNQGCISMLNEMLEYLAANEEYIGWTVWAAGPIWGTASPCCGPTVGSLEPGAITSEGKPNAFSTVWPAAIKPHIPRVLKRQGIANLSL